MLLGFEPERAVMEFVSMQVMDRKTLPKSDGQAVVIFPGLATDHRTVASLKNLCEDLGYAASDWGRGGNARAQGDVGE